MLSHVVGISLVDESSDLREDVKLQELTTGLQYAYTKPVVCISFVGSINIISRNLF